MKKIKAFEGVKPVHEILNDGRLASELRNHRIFQEAINEMYFDLTLEEDKITGNHEYDDRVASQERRKYSMLRTLLTELVFKLDGYILEASNEEYEQELEDNQTIGESK